MATSQKYYTVGVSNKYAAFSGNGSEDSSNDESEVILSSPPPSAVQETAPVNSQMQNLNLNNNKNKNAYNAPQVQNRERNSNRPTTYGRGRGRGGSFGSNRGRFDGVDGAGMDSGMAPREYGDSATGDDLNGPRRRGGFSGRARNHRRGGIAGVGVGSGGQEAGGFGGRREFDRRSGTGKGREIQKKGAGGHNWGSEEQQTETKNIDNDEINVEVQKTVVEGVTEGGESIEVSDNKSEGEKMVDLDTYKKEQEKKREDLKKFVKAEKNTKAVLTTEKELEAQGYVKHVKDSLKEIDCDDGDKSSSEDEGNDRGMRKKKAVNVYQYIQEEGGSYAGFFSARRGRGGQRGGRFHRERGGSREGQDIRRRDAPNFQDTRAFPTLG